MGYQSIFKRYELKYLITKEQKEKMIALMEPYMKLDDYGRDLINNIYYDTPDSLLVRRSLEKPIYKEKLRVRSYGVASADSTVYVEIKKKYKGIVYKRRVSMTEKQAGEYLNKGQPAPVRNQITDEIDYFMKLYRNLQPALSLTYEREAFYGLQDENLRITFDDNILWREDEMSLTGQPHGKPILKPNQVLMEIKVASAMPMWMAAALSELGIYRTSFSKYGTAYMQKQQEKQL